MMSEVSNSAAKPDPGFVEPGGVSQSASNPAAAPEAAATNDAIHGAAGNRLPRKIAAWWSKEKILIAVLAVLFLINWWDMRRQISSLSEEVARRMQAESVSLAQQGQLARAAQSGVAEVAARLAAVEARLAESQSGQAALEALYQDLSRNRDDWALTEIEQTLTIASQQLQLAGNVRGALLALQNADARLGRADKAQFIGVRRALQKDIERLKNLPFIDTSGLALRLDTVIAGADALPLIFDERIQAAVRAPQMKAPPADARESGKGGGTDSGKDAAPAKTAEGPPKGTAGTAGTEASAWRRLRDDAWEQFRQLIRIRDIGDAEPVLLNPTQAFFVRENLKLKLLNARIALLQRNEGLFRSDVDTAIVWLNRYVDVRSKNGASALATLRSLSSSAVHIELPTLADSINAVRNDKAPRALAK